MKAKVLNLIPNKKECLAAFLLATVLFFFLVSCAQIQLGAQAGCGFVQDQRGQRVAWRSADLPMKLRIHQSVPTEAYSAIQECVSKWNEGVGQEMVRVDNLTPYAGSKRNSKDNISTIYWWNEGWSYSQNTHQAKTTVHWTSYPRFTKANEADIHINAQHFDLALSKDNLDSGKVDFVSLCIHEMGHALGLTHNEKDSVSVMLPFLARGQLRQDLSPPDLGALHCGYGNDWVNYQPDGGTFDPITASVEDAGSATSSSRGAQ